MNSLGVNSAFYFSKRKFKLHLPKISDLFHIFSTVTDKSFVYKMRIYNELLSSRVYPIKAMYQNLFQDKWIGTYIDVISFYYKMLTGIINLSDGFKC